MSGVQMRHARRSDLDDIIELWVDAFSSDPFLRWIQPDDARWHEFGSAWIGFIVALTFERGHTYVGDAFATIIAARGHALEESHWTLQYIGVRSHLQGTGLGAAAMGPMLEVCDAERLPCGLVSTNPRNVPFYERHGFRVAAEVATPDGVAAMRPMHRVPLAPASN